MRRSRRVIVPSNLGLTVIEMIFKWTLFLYRWLRRYCLLSFLVRDVVSTRYFLTWMTGIWYLHPTQRVQHQYHKYHRKDLAFVRKFIFCLLLGFVCFCSAWKFLTIPDSLTHSPQNFHWTWLCDLSLTNHGQEVCSWLFTGSPFLCIRLQRHTRLTY
jgi:hypothetical protein